MTNFSKQPDSEQPTMELAKFASGLAFTDLDPDLV